MYLLDKKIYINMARNTNVFDLGEIHILNELLDDIQNNPDTSYILFEETEGKDVAGFCIFGKTPMTKFNWDIYWIVVDRNFQKKGIGTRLLRRIEDFIIRKDQKPGIRIETSTVARYAAARSFYRKMGFNEVGLISDFYGENDNLVTYWKSVSVPISQITLAPILIGK